MSNSTVLSKFQLKNVKRNKHFNFFEKKRKKHGNRGVIRVVTEKVDFVDRNNIFFRF